MWPFRPRLVWNCNSGCPAIDPVGQHRNAPLVPAGDNLESVLIWPQEVEVNAWISTAPPAHIAAGVHDPYGGEDIRRDFTQSVVSGPPGR
jgi:hypothetical protein